MKTSAVRQGARSSWAAALVVVVLALALPVAVGACGSASSPGDTGTAGPGPSEKTSDGFVLAMSDVSRLTSSASPSDLDAATDSIQLFGADLYRVLAEQAGDGNLVFSPTSIVTALAMTYAGAAGTTAEEMAATLHFTLEGDALHQAFNSLDATLESRSNDQEDAGGKPEDVLVSNANSLWALKGWDFEPVFLDTLAANYGAGVRLVDCGTPAAAEEARRAINDWVAGETEDKIPALVPQGALDDAPVLILVNAMYLRALWADRFIPAISEGQFTTLANDSVTVPMMHQSEFFPYASGDGWQAVELPYVGGDLAMLLIVPDEGRFAEIESGLSAGLIDDVVGQLGSSTEVSLVLPKFEFRWKDGLKEVLTSMGMGRAFDPGSADFSGMRRAADIWIDDVVHEAYIAVDEDGTEAAAATAVTMVASASTGVPDLVRLTIDRPFIFALRDRETGALLFLGRVADPSKS